MATKQLSRGPARFTIGYAAQAEALFVSSLQPSDRPAPPQVYAAIAASMRAYHGVSGCAARMAVEYGEHPEEAAARMRWALALVNT